MVNYTCYRCGYETHIKTIIIRHLSRKNICGLKKYDIDLNKFKQYIENGYNCDEYLESINLGKSSVNVSQKSVKNHNISTNDHIISQQSTNIKCKYCDKIYSRIDSLNRHLKTCKEKKKDEEVKKSMNELVALLNKQNDDLNKQNDDLKKQLEKRDKQIDELIKKAGINNSTITNNIQNNIKLLAYKDTDISNITDKDILKCMNHSNMCVPHLIKMIHLDPDKPENHNIYISNLKNGYIMIYDGTKWDTKNREEIIDDMINDKQGMIEERVENWLETGKKYPSIMKKFERYLEKKENDIVINKIKEEVKLMLYNNKILIKNKEIQLVDECVR